MQKLATSGNLGEPLPFTVGLIAYGELLGDDVVDLEIWRGLEFPGSKVDMRTIGEIDCE